MHEEEREIVPLTEDTTPGKRRVAYRPFRKAESTKNTGDQPLSEDDRPVNFERRVGERENREGSGGRLEGSTKPNSYVYASVQRYSTALHSVPLRHASPNYVLPKCLPSIEQLAWQSD